MTEIIYDIDPAHVATCDKPLGACPMCAAAYGLRDATEPRDQNIGRYDDEPRGCECELDWNCGCGRYLGLPPIDVLMDRWSQDHP